MICKRCGRKLSDGASICRGCGYQYSRSVEAGFQPLSETAQNEVTFGQKNMPLWKFCTVLASVVLALALVAGLFPLVKNGISQAVEDKKLREQQEAQAAAEAAAEAAKPVEIDSVTGEVLTVTYNFANCEEQGEHAYSDGTWERSMLINGKVRLHIYRRLSSDSWVTEHIPALYPDVIEVESFDVSPIVSGYATQRIQLSGTSYAEDCAVEIVLVPTASYDHLFVMEIPLDDFQTFEAESEEWLGALSIIDHSSGLELMSPDFAAANTTAVNAAAAGTNDPLAGAVNADVLE